MTDPLIPTLTPPCVCNCAVRDRIADLQKIGLQIWQDEIDDIEAEGFRQVIYGYFEPVLWEDHGSIPGFDGRGLQLIGQVANHLVDVIRRAREKSDARWRKFQLVVDAARAHVIDVDYWGTPIEDMHAYLCGFAERQDARSDQPEQGRGKNQPAPPRGPLSALAQRAMPRGPRY